MIEISLSRRDVPVALRQRCLESFDRALRSTASGFPQLTERAEVWEESAKVGAELRRRFDELVVVGIGGSSLGSQVIADLSPRSRLEFLDNVDAVAFERFLQYPRDWKRTGFLFVSKSGNTIETLTTIEFLREFFEAQGLRLENHAHVLTESRTNELGVWAETRKVPLTLLNSDVGGRFSVLSQVGMIPAAFDGLDVSAFREGAREALRLRDVTAEFMAQTFLSFERGEWITLFWFYHSGLRSYGAWLQQLWAESLGKKVNRQGQPASRASTPLSAVGAIDQHSLLQQVMDGARDKFVVFVRVDSGEAGSHRLQSAQFASCQSLVGRPMGHLLQAEALATEEALWTSGISTLTLRTQVLDARNLGGLFMWMQLVVAGMGELLDLNAFDQPGVELGKRLAKQRLAQR